MPVPRSLPTAPVWLIGLSASPFGFYGGICYYAVPQLLAARHVPEAEIAGMTGILIFTGVLCCVVAPILDVRFSRRWYATVTCALSAALLVAALLCQTDLRVLTVLLFVGNLLMSLMAAAQMGWFASVIATPDLPTVNAWSQIANIGSGGLMAALSVRVIRYFPLPVAAGLLAAIVMLPLLIFPFIPSPGPDRLLAKESFGGLIRSVVSLFRRSEVLLVMLLFALPSSSFTLTNILSGLGADFHTSESTVSLFNGAGVTFAGVVACLLGERLCTWLPLRRLYLGVGIAGGLFTLLLLRMPHSPMGFGTATLGENAFQAIAFTVGGVISMRTVGHDNPLAATEMSIFTAALNLPLVYMQFIDSRAYTRHGLAGAFTADAGISMVVCALLLGLLWHLRSRSIAAAKTLVESS
jgi:PAT family beta-lactamase induction signal transducer AmpG